MPPRTVNERSVDEVNRWRRERLMESGFPLSVAAEVAKNAHYDLHTLIELVERGCPPELALRILAPVEEDTAV